MNSVNLSKYITKAFGIIIKEKPLYLISFNPRKVIHVKDLRFKTGVYIRHLMRDYKKGYKPIQYLFVIEYSQNTITGNAPINNRLGEHVHLILSTDIAQQRLEDDFVLNWVGKVNLDFRRIDNRKDLSELSAYITKQEKFLSPDNVRTNVLKFSSLSKLNLYRA